MCLAKVKSRIWRDFTDSSQLHDEVGMLAGHQAIGCLTIQRSIPTASPCPVTDC